MHGSCQEISGVCRWLVSVSEDRGRVSGLGGGTLLSAMNSKVMIVYIFGQVSHGKN